MNTRYLEEILQQPEALHRAVDGYPVGHPDLERLTGAVAGGTYHHIILTGMGISYYSCYPLWLSLSQQALPVTLWDAAELVHYAPRALTSKTLLIAVSQSGESAELKRIMDLPHRPGMVVGITNGRDNSLARWCDLALATQAGAETAVSTKTYVTGLAMLHLLSRQLLGGDPRTAQATLHRVADQVGDFLSGWESKVEAATAFLGPHVRVPPSGGCDALAFLARGPSMASAMAGALMSEEASRILATAMSSAQFRHGPVEAVREGFRAVMFAGDGSASQLNYQMAAYIAACGGRTLVIAPQHKGENMPPGVAHIPIARSEPELLPILEIIPVQLLTITLARARGYEPAAFINCNKVTTEE
jgi:glucosamine--fructose-6-phosphate aminotransferase (isomerizing)